MLAAVSTSETSVNLYKTTRRNILEDSQLHTRLHENLKSHLACFSLNDGVINDALKLCSFIQQDTFSVTWNASAVTCFKEQYQHLHGGTEENHEQNQSG
jgi:hypothetical protein